MKTIRQSRHDLPLATRASEVKQLNDCPMSYALRLVAERDMAEASFFALGEIVHECLAAVVTDDLTEDQAIDFVIERIDARRLSIDPETVIETTKRTLDSMPEDAIRMVRSYFRWVHPSSTERLPLFDEYRYPPRVEQTYVRTDLGTLAPAYGTLDAVYEAKDPSQPNLIVDFKGSVRKVSDDFQLQMYRLLSGQPEARAVFVYLDRKQARAMIQDAEPYPGDAAVISKIRMAETIKARIIETARARAAPGRHCGTCTARTVCPIQLGTDASMAFVARRLKNLKPVLTPVNISLA